MSSAGKGSDVWKYFSKATEKVGHVKCSICHSFLQYKDSSTSSMRKHLAGRHDININSKNNKTESSNTSSSSKKRKLTDDDDSGGLEVGHTSVGKPIQLGLRQAFAAGKPLDSKSPKAKLLTSKVAKMVYLDLQPISVVEDEGFRETMHAAEPRYVLPTRRTLRSKILPDLYNSAVTVLKAKIAQYKETYQEHALFSVTTDGWTANNTTSYIAYTLHIVGPSYSIESHVLGVAELSLRHTKNNLRAHLLSTLQKWEILPGCTETGDLFQSG